MEEKLRVRFTREDILEALQDFYHKTTGDKIDIGFNEKDIPYSLQHGINIEITAYFTEKFKGDKKANVIDESMDLNKSNSNVTFTSNTTSINTRPAAKTLAPSF